LRNIQDRPFETKTKTKTKTASIKTKTKTKTSGLNSQDQDEDQDREKSVSSALKTKTAVSRTTSWQQEQRQEYKFYKIGKNYRRLVAVLYSSGSGQSGRVNSPFPQTFSTTVCQHPPDSPVTYSYDCARYARAYQFFIKKGAKTNDLL